MFLNYRIIFFYLLLSLFLLLGCKKDPEVQGDHYTLEECKKELLDAEDYIEGESIDLIIIEKKERKMYLYKENKIQSTIPVSLGKNPIGNKEEKGDFKTPEGTFWLQRKLCSPKYYRSLCIAYPRPEDMKRAEAKGVNPGGDITIHAQPKWNADGKGDSYTLSRNWTQGCVAVTNAAMKQLWYAVREGVPIIIR
jgi:murein L,D-transpeptidase YafK